MNEKIRELADQAKQYCFEQSQKRLDPEEYMPYSDMYDKKFAELIVQECGVALSPMLRDMISRGRAYDMIKQHFGVE